MSAAWRTYDGGDDVTPPPLDPDDYGRATVAHVPFVELEVITASSFAGRPVPSRPWLVKDWIPDKAVTMLSGDGGVGKSLMAMQVGVAVAAAKDWLGMLPAFGPVLYVSAEDDQDEIHRRLVDIVGAQDDLDLPDLSDFHILPLAGKDAVMATSDGRSIVSATALWQATVAKVQEIRPRLLILDNLADVFAGNENARPEARQFIGILRGAAIRYNLAVLLISHPSLTGISAGTGTSGSTAWSNSVRSRLYLDRAKSDTDDEPDPDLRILRLMKANYAPTGTEVRMRWERGRFKVDGAGPGVFDRMAADARAERAFLALLKRFAEEERHVSDKRSQSFAPVVFAKQPDNEGCGKALFEKAMNRLFATKMIKVENVGPPSRRYSRIVKTEA